MVADLILVLDKGEVVQAGTHTELLKDPNGMYRRIYDIQTRIDAELENEISRIN
jgi:ABC-type multidrug transport system fused ATPase/permease subunit